MFNRFLEQQQDLLEQLGSDKQQKWQRFQLEQRRLDSLKQIHQELGLSGSSTTAFLQQNRLALRQQLSQLLDSQEQEVTLAKLELDHSQRQLLGQFRKVKGLEIYRQKQEKALELKGRRQEQRMLDDWVARKKA